MSTLKSTINLLVPELPRDLKLPLELQEELLIIYQALRNLAYRIDAVTGRTIRDQQELEEAVNEDMRNITLVERYSCIYLPFTMDATYGKLVAVNTSGQAIFPYNEGVRNRQDFQPIGFVAEESVTAGTYGKVCLRGLIKVEGITPNQQLSWNYQTPDGNFIDATLLNNLTCVAVAITDEYIYFTGVTERHSV